MKKEMDELEGKEKDKIEREEKDEQEGEGWTMREEEKDELWG